MGPVVHLQLAPEHGGIAVELPLPEVVAQHQHRVGARLIFARLKGATQQRLDPEQVEEVVGHHAGDDPFRPLQPQQREVHRVILDDPFERLAVTTIILDLGRREAGRDLVRVAGDLVEVHQPVAVLVG